MIPPKSSGIVLNLDLNLSHEASFKKRLLRRVFGLYEYSRCLKLARYSDPNIDLDVRCSSVEFQLQT